MPTPTAAKLLTHTPALVGALVVAGAFAGAAVAIAACGADGVTPTCTYNVTDAGAIVVDPSDGCYQFATCYAANGSATDPTSCCADAGSSITDCCYGYGSEAVVDDAGNPIVDDAGLGTCSPNGGGNPMGN